MDLEKSLLSNITDPEQIKSCWDLGLSARVFEDPTNMRVWQFSVDYWLDSAMKLAPTEAVITQEFPGYTFIESSEAVPWLVKTLKDRFITNQAQAMMIDASDLVNDDPVAALEMIHAEAWETKQATMPRSNRTDMSQSVTVRQQRYEDRVAQLATGTNGGAPIGLPEVDEHVGRLLPGELGVVLGYTGVGKSFFLCESARMARHQGFTPVIFTLEQPVEEFEDRIDCLESGVGYGRFKKGVLDFEESEKLLQGQERLAALGPIHIEQPDRGNRTVLELVNRCRHLGGDYLIIDQLSHMDARPTRYKMDVTEKHSEIIFELDDEIDRTTEGKIPCLLAVQFNRESVKSGNARPALHQIANSSDIERTVDQAYGLSRTKEMKANKLMLLDILKSRRSDSKAWQLRWKLEKTSDISVMSEFTE